MPDIFDGSSSISIRPMTNVNPNPRAPRNIQIAYHSFVEDQENPLDACVKKMVREAPAMQYDAEQRLAANEGGFGLLERLMRLEAHCQIQDDTIKKPESHRQSHLNIRQRAISTWVRDALHKPTERRNEETRRPNKDIIPGGDVRSDAMVVTERYKKSSTEWRSFRTLYGLTPDEVNDLDQHKFCQSLQALDEAATILLRKAKTSLPPEMEDKRKDLVALLLEGKYEEAEGMGSTFFCENEAEEAKGAGFLEISMILPTSFP
ncbi:hypothetical protein FQN52_000161 [Onygenales sp. PD_12]|nr:hypothetical protein FQN52_000161 [Onygenales sp. PD_12]